MLIIGEKINTVNPKVRRAVEERDTAFVRELVLAQAQAGAHLIDVNVGSDPNAEPDNMRWAVELVQGAVDLPLVIDSPNPETVLVGLQACRDKPQAWANSVTLQESRLARLLPAVVEHGCSVVGLCMGETGIASTASGRVEVAKRLAEAVEGWGVSLDKLYLDALVEPISVTPRAALVSLETLRSVRSALPCVKTVICLSAISYGLPTRRLLNRTFLPLLLAAGVDAVILDPLDRRLLATLKASQALLARDPHGLEYIAAHREKRLG